jgi:uncharacterized integral membrane protein
MWIWARWPYPTQQSPWCGVGFTTYLAVGGLLFQKLYYFNIHLLHGGEYKFLLFIIELLWAQYGAHMRS